MNSYTDFSAIDRHVGGRIKLRRLEIGYSQQDLAKRLGVSYQQVQKYEKGSNGVRASSLWVTAKALKAPVPYFYKGLKNDNTNESEQSIIAAASAADLEFIKNYLALEKPLQKSAHHLVRALSKNKAPLLDKERPQIPRRNRHQ